MGRNRGRREPPAGVGGLPIADVTDSTEPGGHVALVVERQEHEHRAFFRPARDPVALGRLTRSQRAIVDELADHGLEISEMQAHMRAMVTDARDQGLSWNVIGWALGLTGEGARRAYGVRYAGEDD